MRLSKILFYLCFLAVSIAAGAEEPLLSRYELSVGDFTELSVVDGLNVNYKCDPDSAGTIVFETTAEIADQILFENNKKGKLSVEKQFHAENEMVWGLPDITVYSRFLTSVTNSGDSVVKVITVKPTINFKATVIGNGRLIVNDIDCVKFDGSIKTGNGTLVASGRCDEASLVNTGVGAIQADRLEAKNATCRFFGSGTTGVWATDSLIIKGMFPGKLYYKGEPKKLKNYAMGVKLYPLDNISRKPLGEEGEPDDEE